MTYCAEYSRDDVSVIERKRSMEKARHKIEDEPKNGSDGEPSAISENVLECGHETCYTMTCVVPARTWRTCKGTISERKWPNQQATLREHCLLCFWT